MCSYKKMKWQLIVFSICHFLFMAYSSMTSSYEKLKENIMKDFLLGESPPSHQADFGHQYYWDDQSLHEPDLNARNSTDGELPCTTYKIMNTADRSADYYDTDVRKCDNELTPGWYRFMQPAGFAGMATQCPEKFACGTYGPGWLKGSHPAINEGIVTRRVCFHAEGDCCMFSQRILVKLCPGQFYVYKLQPPGGCSFRYCGAKAPDACTKYKSLRTADRSIDFYNPTLSLCDKTLETAWYRFQGSAGSQMSEKCVPVFRCGTHSPGWLVGSHPSMLDGQIERQVCFHWFSNVNDIEKRKSNCCSFSKTISAINCGGFYVYRLTSTGGCFARYCAE